MKIGVCGTGRMGSAIAQRLMAAGHEVSVWNRDAAKTRPLSAGTIVGSGTVSNKDADGGPGRPVAEGGLGYSCIAEQRMVETIRFGKPHTPFLKFGDRVRIEMRDKDGRSIFGAIDQSVVRYTPRHAA